jgi:AbiV family abortive infection protein
MSKRNKLDQKIEEKFSQLTIEQYVEGSELALLNAGRLYKCSKLLGFFKFYGPANSLAILSAEESLKSIIIVSKMLGFLSQSEEEVYRFFRDHKIKHSAGWWLGLFNDTFDQSGVDFRGFNNASAEERSTAVRKVYKTQIDVINDRIKNSKTDWWNNANNKKNDGLYVNLDGNPWSTPNSISKVQLKESQSEAHRVLKRTKNFISKIKKSDLEAVVADAKNFNDNYQKASEDRNKESTIQIEK